MKKGNDLLTKLLSASRLARFILVHPRIGQRVLNVRKEKLTYLSYPALIDLVGAIQEVEKLALDGIFLEAGCALGGSAIVIASAKSPERSLFVYDTFEMIPSPGENDGEDVHKRYHQIISGESQGIKGSRYYGYEQNLIEQVKSSFTKYGIPTEQNKIQLIKGLFQDTLFLDQPIAFAHLDCDWYDSLMTCLTRIEPLLVPGGIIVVDDYYDWSGCQKAVDEFFHNKKENFEFKQKSRLHIRRTR
jgi:O-methyltransferase